jgi:hypothetical protein
MALEHLVLLLDLPLLVVMALVTPSHLALLLHLQHLLEMDLGLLEHRLVL